jgi:membrane-associated PAP2 superfamily phosphatase
LNFLLNSRLQLVITLLLMLLSLAFFQLSTVDLSIQHWLYQDGNHAWLWDKHEQVARLVFYDGPKLLLILFAVSLLSGIVASGRFPVLRRHRRDMILVLATLAIVPLIIGVLKTLTNVPCPHALNLFGGKWHYTAVLSHLTADQVAWSGQRCFPASHAGSGFALLALVPACRRSETRKWTLITVLILGWTMGLYKMAIGDHFLSHTVISMLIAWGTVHCLLLIEARWWPLDRRSPSPLTPESDTGVCYNG